MRVLCLALVLGGSIGFADTSVPAPITAIDDRADRECSAREWLAIKHAAARFCAHRHGDGCDTVRRDLERPFCDGEGDRSGCPDELFMRTSLARCRWLGAPSAGVRPVRIQPDCWTWELGVANTRHGVRVTSVEIGGACD